MTRMLARDAARGQVAVEFILVIGVVLVLMLGIFDFGRVVFGSNAMSHAAREAARQASVTPKDCEAIFSVVQQQAAGQTDVAVSVQHRVQASTSNPNPDPTWASPSYCPAYDATAAYDTDPATGALATINASPGSDVRVMVRSTVTLATPLVANIVGGSLTVGGASTMVITFVPQP